LLYTNSFPEIGGKKRIFQAFSRALTEKVKNQGVAGFGARLQNSRERIRNLESTKLHG
jgi:hypothetical protein